MNQRTKLLDDLLPLLDPRHPEVYENAAILEVADAGQLLELAVAPKFRRYLLARLSDTTALIDPGSVLAFTKALRSEGHTPKMVKGAVS